LGGTIGLRQQERDPALAFLSGADIAHETVHGDGKTPFVKLPDLDIALEGLHRDVPRSTEHSV